MGKEGLSKGVLYWYWKQMIDLPRLALASQRVVPWAGNALPVVLMSPLSRPTRGNRVTFWLICLRVLGLHAGLSVGN